MEGKPLNSPPPKRRWFQFSLRTLLIVMLIIAIPCAWVGRKIEQKRREREAVTAIKALGGHVLFDYQVDAAVTNGEPDAIATAEPFGPAWLRKCVGDDFFSDVVCVTLWRRDTGDAASEHLKQLTHLQELWLNTSGLSDAGMANLKEMANLRTFCLNSTRVTDAGLGILSRMAHVETLDLSNTEVTDTGIANLKELPSLKELYLDKTKITDAGVRELQSALPHCVIHQRDE